LIKTDDRGQKTGGELTNPNKETGDERKTRTNNPNRGQEIDPERESHPEAETKFNR